MKLRDIVVEKAIIAPLKSTKRDDAIRELVDCLAANGAVKPALADELSKAVIKRLRSRTSPIKNRICGSVNSCAISYCFNSSRDRMITFLGR